ncbi:hypothetical protein COO60DRAFT_1626392 [Scenedesmus sp. NREL 46B-D3]|nr:hypothetical protein COO60DRAFT_1626392 [Scenedesmus sp. NREL 46B-D3]
MFGMRQCQPGAVPAGASDGEEVQYSCRICFEDAKPSELISPCRCKGSLAHVHPACLHRWQASAARLGGKADERASTCGVCRSRYTSTPPGAGLAAWRKCSSAAGSSESSCKPGTRCMLCNVVVLPGLADADSLPWHLLPTLHTHRRRGAPIEGLRAGSLLVAHAGGLRGSTFARAVVLLTEAGASGAKGVMLTQPMEAVDSQLWGRQQQQRPSEPGTHAGSGGSGAAHALNPALNPAAAIRHYLGGPADSAAAAAAAAAGQGAGLAGKLRWPLPPPRERNAGRHNNQQQQQQRQQASLRLFHGVCVWGPGQLEAEVRAGAWGVVAAAEVSDVVATPPALLWERLLGGDRARWRVLPLSRPVEPPLCTKQCCASVATWETNLMTAQVQQPSACSKAALAFLAHGVTVFMCFQRDWPLEGALLTVHPPLPVLCCCITLPVAHHQQLRQCVT